MSCRATGAPTPREVGGDVEVDAAGNWATPPWLDGLVQRVTSTLQPGQRVFVNPPYASGRSMYVVDHEGNVSRVPRQPRPLVDFSRGTVTIS